MRNLIEKLLARFGWPTRAEHADLVRQLETARAFAKQVAEGVADKAVIVGADDVLLQNLVIDRTLLILPGVRGITVLGCFFNPPA